MTALKLPTLPFALEPAGSPPPGCRVRGGVLTLTGAARTDLFVDPAGADPGRCPTPAGSSGLPPAGDFTLAAQVSVEFASMYDAGVLLLHAAERQWAKLCFEYSPQLTPTAVTVVTRGTSDDCNSFEVDGHTLWLRITRSGAAWAFHASTDGAWWRLLRYFALSGNAEDLVRVGFLAQSPTGEGCAATFDHITFRPARRRTYATGAELSRLSGGSRVGGKPCRHRLGQCSRPRPRTRRRLLRSGAAVLRTGPRGSSTPLSCR